MTAQSGGDGAVVFCDEGGNPLRQLVRGGVGGGAVRRAGPLVATDDLAQRPGGLSGCAAVGKVHPVRKITVLVVAFPDRA
ncbi:hypothetical protein RBA10_22345, partial [Mycobacteroides abscessus subsp. abscessus]|uniref:hypothetical protein n=1 Tax=Mycobacteroides abscessus TaxID=36809 RepID=UPI003CF14AD7